jgi:hypothetical protein
MQSEGSKAFYKHDQEAIQQEEQERRSSHVQKI